DRRVERGLDGARGEGRGTRAAVARLARRISARAGDRRTLRSRTGEEGRDRPLPPPEPGARPVRRQAAPRPAHPHLGAPRGLWTEHGTTCGKGIRRGGEARRPRAGNALGRRGGRRAIVIAPMLGNSGATCEAETSGDEAPAVAEVIAV